MAAITSLLIEVAEEIEKRTGDDFNEICDILMDDFDSSDIERIHKDLVSKK